MGDGMDCSSMGWMHAGGMAVGVLLILVLILSAAALIKYLRQA
jgi:hypothetical protein